MSRYFVALIVALAVVFGVTSGASVGTKNDVVSLFKKTNGNQWTIEYILSLVDYYSFECINDALGDCDSSPEKFLASCVDNYIEEHYHDTCSRQDENLLALRRNNVEKSTVKELLKIAAYLYKLYKNVPTACYIKVILTCRQNPIFQDFKACAEKYISENQEQCTNNGELLTALDKSKDGSIQEIIKIAAYLSELVQRVPITCYIKVVLTCAAEDVYENYKACSEKYIAENPSECSVNTEVADANNGSTDLLRDIFKIAQYLFKLSKEIPATCFMSVAYTCKGEKTYENFHVCAENYIAANPEKCNKKSEVFLILNDVSVSELAFPVDGNTDASDLELFKIALYIRKLAKTVPTNCFVKLLSKCRKSKSYSDFKLCGDTYIEDNKADCTLVKRFF